MLEGYRTGVDRIPKEVCVNGVLNDKRAGKIGFRGEIWLMTAAKGADLEKGVKPPHPNPRFVP